MRRYFNTEGWCSPDRHYMVRLEERLDKIKRFYVDREKYFIINRGRQYGKTTTLKALTKYLADDYTVIAMDFQRISSACFADEKMFVISFIEYMEKMFFGQKALQENIPSEAFQEMFSLKGEERISLDKLFFALSRICDTARKPVVMMIDEVDNASNHQVFLDFLAMLRGYYLDRDNTAIFHSVILAGVYDIKNLKLKIRPDSEHQYNSPWNIAADFDIKMNFSADQIRAMLEEYEEDNRTGMDVSAMAEEIYQYTSGYPYLVSALCKILDEKLPEELPEELQGRLPEGTQGRLSDGQPERLSESLQGRQPGELPAGGSGKGRKSVWSGEGLAEAVKILLNEKSPLFDSMMKQLDTYKELRILIEEIVYQGKKVPFSPFVKSVNLGLMFGYLKDDNGRIVIANRIFEMCLMNMLITEESLKSEAYRLGDRDRNRFIRNGRLNMRLVLEKFVEYFHEVYGENDEKFVESCGRKFFLLFLKPIINGTGNYYLEAQTRDMGRTDVVVDYRGEQFVVEMKIWRGNEYNERGERQMTEYLDYFRREKGYMLSFNFDKKKEIGVKEIAIGDKTIVEAVV